MTYQTTDYTDPGSAPTPPRYGGSTGGYGGTSSIDIGAILAEEKGSFGTATDEQYVLRGYSNPKIPIGTMGRRPGPQPVRSAMKSTSTLSRYNAEFFERWQDVNFQTWLQSRRAALDPRGDPTVEGAYGFWVDAGKATAAARGTRWTPEQYIEYMANGGTLRKTDEIAKDITTGSYMLDANGHPITFESALAADQPNPITTQRNVTYNSINPLAANAAVDKMSQALLGRMATKAEMARMRGAMNSILKKNPEVATTTRDATDEDNVNVTTKTKAGMSAAEAGQVVEMRMQRSSEGMAAGVGGLFEAALRAL